jgi:hypothetical protein
LRFSVKKRRGLLTYVKWVNKASRRSRQEMKNRSKTLKNEEKGKFFDRLPLSKRRRRL